jgi:hypothetical protein
LLIFANLRTVVSCERDGWDIFGERMGQTEGKDNMEPESKCLTPQEKLYVRNNIPNLKLNLFLDLNKIYHGELACEECEAYMKDLIKARAMRHEVS